MNIWKQNLRTHRSSFFSAMLIFAGSQVALFREYLGLVRVHHSPAIVWCCEALFLLGMVSLFIGSRACILEDSQNPADRSASVTAVGVLVIFLSMILQFDVWETIGKYSMFYQLHPSQNISELHNK